MIKYLESMIGKQVSFQLVIGGANFWGPYEVVDVQVDRDSAHLPNRAVVLLRGKSNEYAVNVDQIVVILPVEKS